MLTDLCSLTLTQVGTGWVSHVHEQGKEAAAARGEAPLQEAPRSCPALLLTTY